MTEISKRERRQRPLALLGMALLALLAPAAASAQNCEAKIGVMGPMSGSAALWGISARNGTELAAAEYNETGGLPMNGRKCKVVVVSYDSKYTAEGAAAGSNSLASQGVSVIVGPVGSPEGTGVKPVAERNKQLTINSGFARDAIGPKWPLAFHAAPGPGTWALPLAKIAKEKYGFNSVVIVAPNDQTGTDTAAVDAEAYKSLNVKVTEEYYQRGTTNFAPIVARIMRLNPEVVDTASSPPADAGTMVKQLLEAGYKGMFGRLGGSGTEEIIKAAGSVEALGNMYWLESVWLDKDKTAKLLERQKAMAQNPPGNVVVVALFAASARMALKAISSAGTATDGPKVAQALLKLPVEDTYLGKGQWTGTASYGIQQEFGFPVGMGMIVKGKNLGVSLVDVGEKN